jgi:hypothetical protein
VRLDGLGAVKKNIYSIGSRTRGHPACSVAPLPSMLQLIKEIKLIIADVVGVPTDIRSRHLPYTVVTVRSSIPGSARFLFHISALCIRVLGPILRFSGYRGRFLEGVKVVRA